MQEDTRKTIGQCYLNQYFYRSNLGMDREEQVLKERLLDLNHNLYHSYSLYLIYTSRTLSTTYTYTTLMGNTLDMVYQHMKVLLFHHYTQTT